MITVIDGRESASEDDRVSEVADSSSSSDVHTPVTLRQYLRFKVVDLTEATSERL